MCNKMPLAIFLLVLVIGAAAADLFMVMEKKEEIVKPISEHIIIYSATNEPYFGTPMKPWKEPEVHTCIPGQDGCGAVFKVNGEEVDYWEWKIMREVEE